jgi:Protein of unknown function (DUF3292).
MVPPVRLLLFPGLARTDGSNGSSPPRAQVQSEDSLTGAPENHKGEAAEQEAKNMVDSFATVAMESAAARYGQTVTEDAPHSPALIESLEAAEAAAGTPTGDSPEDKTKSPWRRRCHMRPIMSCVFWAISLIYMRNLPSESILQGYMRTY